MGKQNMWDPNLLHAHQIRGKEPLLSYENWEFQSRVQHKETYLLTTY